MWVHTRLMLSLLPETVSVPLVFSVLLHDIAKPATWNCDPAEGRIRFNGHDKLGAEMTGRVRTVLVAGEVWRESKTPVAAKSLPTAKKPATTPAKKIPAAAAAKSVGVKPSAVKIPTRPTAARPPRAGLGHRRNKQ